MKKNNVSVNHNNILRCLIKEKYWVENQQMQLILWGKNDFKGDALKKEQNFAGERRKEGHAS